MHFKFKIQRDRSFLVLLSSTICIQSTYLISCTGAHTGTVLPHEGEDEERRTSQLTVLAFMIRKN